MSGRLNDIDLMSIKMLVKMRCSVSLNYVSYTA